MSISAWQKIAKQKNEVENQIKNINNLIISSKLSDELGQIKYEKLLKPVTSRLDTQIELTKGLKDDEIPNYTQHESIVDRDEMPDYTPPPSLIDDDEMPDHTPPPSLIDDDEMPDHTPPPSLIDDDEMSDFKQKRKEWEPSSIKKIDQQELDKERSVLAEKRRRVKSHFLRVSRIERQSRKIEFFFISPKHSLR